MNHKYLTQVDSPHLHRSPSTYSSDNKIGALKDGSDTY